MSNMKVEKLYFDRAEFIKALRNSPLVKPNTIANLSYRTQVSEATVYKALKDGYLSRRTYDRLKECIDFEVHQKYDSRK